MLAHMFDPVTRLYLGSVNADRSPLESGVFLLPANATFVAPPVGDASKPYRWDAASSSWEAGQEDTTSGVPEVAFRSSEDIIAEVKAKIDSTRECLATEGVSYKGVWWPTDIVSRWKYSNLLVILAEADYKHYPAWKVLGGNFCKLESSHDLRQILGEIMEQDLRLLAASENHKKNLYKVFDPENYDYTSNWPETFWHRLPIVANVSEPTGDENVNAD